MEQVWTILDIGPPLDHPLDQPSSDVNPYIYYYLLLLLLQMVQWSKKIHAHNLKKREEEKT